MKRFLLFLTVVFILTGCTGRQVTKVVVGMNDIAYTVHDGIKDNWQKPLDDLVPLDDFRVVLEPEIKNPGTGYVGIKFTF